MVRIAFFEGPKSLIWSDLKRTSGQSSKPRTGNVGWSAMPRELYNGSDSDSDSDSSIDFDTIWESIRKEEQEHAALLDNLSKLTYPCSEELCTTACNKLFWGARNYEDNFKHIKTLSILRLNAQAGCRLCISFLWKLETQSAVLSDSRIPEELDLALKQWPIDSISRVWVLVCNLHLCTMIVSLWKRRRMDL